MGQPRQDPLSAVCLRLPLPFGGAHAPDHPREAHAGGGDRCAARDRGTAGLGHEVGRVRTRPDVVTAIRRPAPGPA